LLEGLLKHLPRISTIGLYQHIGKRGFAINFTHYNGSRASIDTFDINTYDDLPLSPNSKGYVNSFGTKVDYTFVNHFGSRGSLTTSV
jgi:hypothetical protein